MDEINTTAVLENSQEAFWFLVGGNQKILFVLFVAICAIQFVLVFILYRENKKSYGKISNLENLLEVTTERVLSIKDRTDAVTYQEVVSRLQAGEEPLEISKTVSVSLKELEALKRLIKTVG